MMSGTTNSRGDILAVDDTPANLRVLSELLGAEGYSVRVATSGARALDATRAAAPDLILLDVSMPVMDGYACCRLLKSEPETAGIPVVFLTGHADTEHVLQGFAAGGVDYVTKPFREPELVARVRTQVELRRLQRMLEAMSLQDALTGIANRRRFDAVLEQEWRRAQRSARHLSLVLADVDHFKKYNDGHGHAAGDTCLRDAAQAFASAFQRGGDLAARYGGEEFVAILPDTDAATALELAEKARRAVADLALPHAYSTTAPHVTMSIGVATCVPDDAGSAPGLVERADKALYRAKHEGRDRVVAA